jgi:flavin-dependent dehydrogenase
VWDEFQQAGHLPSPGNCSAWGGGELTAKDFIFNPHGSAWQLDRPRFETMLLKAAEVAGAQVWRGHAWQKIQRRPGGWEVATEEKSRWNARSARVKRARSARSTLRQHRATWLLDASGRGSTVARQFGAAREILDKLVAIYAIASSPANANANPNPNVDVHTGGDTDTDADARTYIEACADGWWYSALMPGRRRIFAFQTDADLLPGQQWRGEAWFRQRVEATSYMRGLFESHDYKFDDAPRLTSAHSSRLAHCHGDGWLAAGDAAQSFDPLSGEGLFHALLTGRYAAQSLMKNLAGEQHGQAEYAALAQSLWRRFVQNRQNIYAQEMRWPEEPFWRRRCHS